MPGTVCLDFDDTLCGRDKRALPGAREALLALREAGHRLLVSSARFSPIYGVLNEKRMQRVRDWLEERDMPCDDVVLFVPRADVYVDDLAHRFDGRWEHAVEPILEQLSSGWRLARRGGINKQVSLSLDSVWSEGAPTAGAVKAVERFADLGVRVVVSAGPALADVAGPWGGARALRERLKAAGLKVRRVDPEKIASDLYVNPRGLRYAGDWNETLEALVRLLA